MIVNTSRGVILDAVILFECSERGRNDLRRLSLMCPCIIIAMPGFRVQSAREEVQVLQRNLRSPVETVSRHLWSCALPVQRENVAVGRVLRQNGVEMFSLRKALGGDW